MKACVFGLLLFVATPAWAQSTRIDRLTPAFPTVGERHAADVVSWVTVAASLGLDGVATLRKDCRGSWDRCQPALVLTGLRIGSTFAATWAIKKAVHRSRPCAPVCGRDDAMASFPSAHTAFAFSAIGGPRLVFSLPLAVGTGGLRIAADKHYLTDVLAGAGIGLVTSRIR